jgi:hypothetical protein
VTVAAATVMFVRLGRGWLAEVDVVRVVLRGWSVGMCACVCGGCVLSVLSVLSVSVPI